MRTNDDIEVTKAFSDGIWPRTEVCGKRGTEQGLLARNGSKPATFCAHKYNLQAHSPF